MPKQEKMPTIEQSAELNIDKIREVVRENAERIAKLGKWPEYIPPESILERIPEEGQKTASGFDAGIACSLDLIPREKQGLSATLHANYSKEAVIQVREEFAKKNPDSATTWWLAASSLCEEGEVDEEKFIKQIKDFEELVNDAEKREKEAEKEFEKITAAYELRDGVPYGEKDGCIQGAYIDGYSFGVQFSKEYGIYFIGTYEESLGLENFDWSDEKDEDGRDKSGPVFGSKQFVKCANEDELKRALNVVKEKLSLRE